MVPRPLRLQDAREELHVSQIVYCAESVIVMERMQGIPISQTQRLIDAYATIPKLVNQVHLPVQAGSDRVLAAMKRGYTVLEYKSIIRRLRAVRPDISIATDIIVGFPGESDADFEATMRLIDDIQFDGAYSFVYSRRPGTPAADLPDETPQEVKLARLQRLQALVDEQSHSVSRAMVGTCQRTLVTVAAFTALKLDSQIRKFGQSALNMGLSKTEVIEAIIQTAPLTGFAPALNALGSLSEALR